MRRLSISIVFSAIATAGLAAEPEYATVRMEIDIARPAAEV